uniref:Uncharacterized protein n=1 Tax=Arundo donax TaxID=35708 RepID=A0A0A9FA81_ARUDO
MHRDQQGHKLCSEPSLSSYF